MHLWLLSIVENQRLVPHKLEFFQQVHQLSHSLQVIRLAVLILRHENQLLKLCLLVELLLLLDDLQLRVLEEFLICFAFLVLVFTYLLSNAQRLVK